MFLIKFVQNYLIIVTLKPFQCPMLKKYRKKSSKFKLHAKNGQKRWYSLIFNLKKVLNNIKYGSIFTTNYYLQYYST